MANVEVGAETAKDKVAGAAQGASQATKQAAASPWVEKAARFGYLVRGVLYGLVGVLALQAAIGAGGELTDKQGAIHAVASQRGGTFLLILIAVGLAGYSLWGFVRAIGDPLRKATGKKGPLVRLGYLASALSYGAALFITLQVLMGSGGGGGNSQQSQGLLSNLMSQPFGKWLVVLAGLIMLGGGLGQIWKGVTTDFKDELKQSHMSADEEKLAVWSGRIGMGARGIVFGLTGIFTIVAGWQSDPKQARGFDGALAALGQQPYGRWVLGTVAAGLVLFGLYSMLSARWAKITPQESQE